MRCERCDVRNNTCTTVAIFSLISILIFSLLVKSGCTRWFAQAPFENIFTRLHYQINHLYRSILLSLHLQFASYNRCCDFVQCSYITLHSMNCACSLRWFFFVAICCWPNYHCREGYFMHSRSYKISSIDNLTSHCRKSPLTDWLVKNISSVEIGAINSVR